MDWTVNRELIDQVIFAMENQDSIFYLDTQTGVIVSEDEIQIDEEGLRFQELPVWRSLEGFQLMERFIATIRNPLFREELRESLTAGRGVFRAFKNALKARGDLEKLWYNFKEREMTRIVHGWISDLREIEGLETLQLPEEETNELILSDFSFTANFQEYLDDILKLDFEVIQEAYTDFDPSRVEEHYRELRQSHPGPDEEGSLVVSVETPAGQFAGFAWGVERSGLPEEGYTMDLVQLALVQEYQDLGLGKALLGQFIQRASETGSARVRITLPRRFLGITRLFEREGFRIAAQMLELDLTLWEQESGAV